MTVNQSVINELKARRYFTPDFKDEVEQYDNHVVFIWDSFKLSFPSERHLKDNQFLGEAFTVENNFLMKVCPTFPIIWQCQEKDKGKFNETRVWGEAYVLSPLDIVRMDAIMDNMGSYRRRRRYIAMNDQEWPGGNNERRVTINAWIYIATDEFRTQVDTGMNWGTQVRRNGKNYWEWIHRNMHPVH